jgi:hypothetical protein
MQGAKSEREGGGHCARVALAKDGKGTHRRSLLASGALVCSRIGMTGRLSALRVSRLADARQSARQDAGEIAGEDAGEG